MYINHRWPILSICAADGLDSKGGKAGWKLRTHKSSYGIVRPILPSVSQLNRGEEKTLPRKQAFFQTIRMDFHTLDVTWYTC